MQRKSIDQIYWEASQIERPTDQQHFLEEQCGEDNVLRSKVERLLTLRIDAESFLESPPVALMQSAELGQDTVGTAIGPYRLLQKIGEGGMGTVWIAEQLKPVHRRVAVKIIKPGMDSQQVIARFEAERQALALMNHPNIAKVLDVGTMPSQISDFRFQNVNANSNLNSEIDNLKSAGRPYFVMELLKGVPITKYCDEQKLTPRQRVELFIPVCEAIHHAHRKGIIHRDIKPSNVLVCPFDGKPVPKVIDFGVAKATGHRLTDKTLFTEFGQVIGTLEYMSPEQAELNNLDIDTRSDIYSLGVLLYELLTGSTPIILSKTNEVLLIEILRTIREVDPPTPSNHLSTTAELPQLASNRSLAPARLPVQIRGELDWIVMKCLEKDRNRRYESSNELAVDLQRYLRDEEVVACPPSTAYRLRKFVQRNRVAVTSAVALLIVLLAGIAGTSIALAMALRSDHRSRLAAIREKDAADAERIARAGEVAQRRQAEEVATLVESLFRNLDPVTEPEELKFRLVEQLQAMATNLETDYRGDPLVRARMRATLASVHHKIGNHRESVALNEKVLAERREVLGPDHPDTLAAMHALAGSYEFAASRGDTHLRTKGSALLKEWHEKTLVVSHADSEQALKARTSLAFQLGRAGEVRTAVQMQQDVLERRREMNGPDHRDSIQALRDLAHMHGFAGDKAKQMLMLEEAYAKAKQKIGSDDKLTAILLTDLAANNIVQMKYDRAIELYAYYLETLIAKGQSKSIAAYTTMNSLADAYQRAGRVEMAIPLFEQSHEGLKKHYPLAVESIDRALRGLASAYNRTSQFDKNLETRKEILEQVRSRKGPDDPATIQAMFVLASAHVRVGQNDKAIPLFETVLAKRKSGTMNRGLPDAQVALAAAYQDCNRTGEAITCYRDGIAGFRAVFGEGDNLNIAFSQGSLGALLVQQKQFKEAESVLRQSHAVWAKVRPDDWSASYVESILGAAIAGQERFAEAENLLINGYEGMKQRESKMELKSQSRLADGLERIVQFYEKWEKKEQADAWRAKRTAAKSPSPGATKP